MLRTILTAVFILAILFGGVAGYTLLSVERLPGNRPGRYEPRPEDKTVVFAGDSITQGRISADYVKLVEDQAKNWTVINAGVNGDLAFNLVSRFEEILFCRPERVFILIGTNDVNAAFSEENSSQAVKLRRLPQDPSLSWFRENLNSLFSILTSQSEAELAVYTIPPIGETLNHPINESVREYNKVIREVAADYNITVLPLYEEIAVALAENAPENFKPRDPVKFTPMMNRAAFGRALFGRSFDKLGEKNGYLYHSDPLHLDEDGALFAANLAAELLLGKTRSQPGIF